jgi:hypothetical protein
MVPVLWNSLPVMSRAKTKEFSLCWELDHYYRPPLTEQVWLSDNSSRSQISHWKLFFSFLLQIRGFWGNTISNKIWSVLNCFLFVCSVGLDIVFNSVLFLCFLASHLSLSIYWCTLKVSEVIDFGRNAISLFELLEENTES